MMGVRWRASGELLCEVGTEPMEGDTEIGDRLLYELSVEQKVLVADRNHKENRLWHWTKDVLIETRL